MLSQLGNLLRALLIGLIGGGVFYALSLPLPWTLGAMTASALVAVAGYDWGVPISVRDFARPVVGVMAGGAFTPAVVASLATWWPAILVLLVYSLVMVLLGWLFFTRIFRLDRTTAFFASSPGGLGELTLLGSSLGGDLRSLVLIHSMRVVIVVFSAPFIVQLLSGQSIVRSTLAANPAAPLSPEDALILGGCAVLGFIIGRLFRIPGGVMIPALLLSAGAHALELTASTPPAWLVALVQVVIGTIAGSRFSGVRWGEMTRVLVGGFIWALALLGGAILAAEVGTLFLDPPAAALALAFMPGGMAEMTIIAYAIGFEVAFVVTCQVCRIMFVFISSPILFSIFGDAGAGSSTLRAQDKDEDGKH